MARQKPKRPLTELEGAALSVISRLKKCTPYQVRVDFQKSRSHEWSGSAGAVYPALRRLHAAGFLRSHAKEEGRRSVEFALTPLGRRVFSEWLADVERACGSGLDPFRCRADYWDNLSNRGKETMRNALIGRLRRKCAEVEALLAESGRAEREGLKLELALHRTRLDWLGRKFEVGDR